MPSSQSKGRRNDQQCLRSSRRFLVCWRRRLWPVGSEQAREPTIADMMRCLRWFPKRTQWSLSTSESWSPLGHALLLQLAFHSPMLHFRWEFTWAWSVSSWDSHEGYLQQRGLIDLSRPAFGVSNASRSVLLHRTLPSSSYSHVSFCTLQSPNLSCLLQQWLHWLKAGGCDVR